MTLPLNCQTDVKRTRVAVVGAGLAGLMTARRLGHHGVSATVFEARPRVGGRVLSNTKVSNGRITEEGASSSAPFTRDGSRSRGSVAWA